MIPHSSSRGKQTRWVMAPLPAMPQPAQALAQRRVRRLGVWLLALTLPELVGGVLLVRALPWAAALRADLGIALLAAAALQVTLGLALWRRSAHWWVLLAFVVVGFAWALLR